MYIHVMIKKQRDIKTVQRLNMYVKSKKYCIVRFCLLKCFTCNNKKNLFNRKITLSVTQIPHIFFWNMSIHDGPYFAKLPSSFKHFDHLPNQLTLPLFSSFTLFQIFVCYCVFTKQFDHSPSKLKHC